MMSKSKEIWGWKHLPKQKIRTACILIALGASSIPVAWSAPDEELLGKSKSYPIAPHLSQAFWEPYRVGSFSGMDRLSPHCVLEPSANPLSLPVAKVETTLEYRFQGRNWTLDDYMQRQRASAVVVVKDGQVVAQRMNYERKPDDRMLSNSMAKTIVALGIGKALEEGLIKSLEDTAQTYEPQLAGTLYGQTQLINLMRMASGAQFVEDYSGKDDHARFNRTIRQSGQRTRGRAGRAVQLCQRRDSNVGLGLASRNRANAVQIHWRKNLATHGRSVKSDMADQPH